MPRLTNGKQPRWTAAGLLLVAFGVSSLLPGFAFAQQPQQQTPLEMKVRVLEKGSSTKESLALAIQALPMQKLTAQDQGTINYVIQNLSMFRRMPTVTCPMEPEVYDYFAQNPHVAVNIWRALDISEFEMWQVSKTDYQADSGDGTKGVVRMVYDSPTDKVVICHGEFKSPLLLRTVNAVAILHLQTVFFKDQTGENQVSHRLDMLVSFTSSTVEVAAKAFAPMSNKILDSNFEEITLFLFVMTHAMQERPDWVARVAAKLDVPPANSAQLLQVTREINAKARRREQIIRAQTAPAPATVPLGQ